MIRAFFSVGIWTLISRITGFLRDVLLASHLGAGVLMDAFAVAFRLPNHFRAIFAEGAFTSAFLPALARVRETGGTAGALMFQGRMLSLVLISQLVLLALVMAFTPGFVRLLAPGFTDRPEVMDLAINLTRITFPYLAMITLVVFWSAVLNAERRFIEGAAAPVLLNIAMISTLLAGTAFTTFAHAAAWGVFIAGFLEAGLLAYGAYRLKLLVRPKRPLLDDETRKFFRALGPALIGAGAVQMAMLADTILVTFLAPGGASALYYADRLYQLPVGVIGVAAGTVILPEMSRLLASGKTDAAHKAQNRALGLSWLMGAPFIIAFLMIPEVIVAAIFGYGAFGSEAVRSTAGVLAAYAPGLIAILGIRSVIASFHARGDTKTPLYAAFAGIGINIVLKLILWRSMGAAGLALATSIGALVNFGILAMMAIRQNKAAPDLDFAVLVAIIATATLWLAAALRWADMLMPGLQTFSPLIRLMIYGLIGAGGYAAIGLLGCRIAGIPLRRGLS